MIPNDMRNFAVSKDDKEDFSLDDILEDDAEAPEGQTEATEAKSDDEPELEVSASEEGEPEAKAEGQVEASTEDKPPETVPLASMLEERARRRAAEEEASRQIAELRGQLQQLAQMQQAAAMPQKEEEPELEIWDNPKAFTQRQLQPIHEAMRQQNERFSRMMAVQTHGEEVVNAAYKALGEAVQTDPNAMAELQRIQSSDHPFEAVVNWHRQKTTLSQVGDDPEKWFNDRLEQFLSDPAKQGELLKRIQGNASKSTQQSRPNVQLPPSLKNLPGGGNTAADDDMSDAALFDYATA